MVTDDQLLQHRTQKRTIQRVRNSSGIVEESSLKKHGKVIEALLQRITLKSEPGGRGRMYGKRGVKKGKTRKKGG